MTVEVRMPSLGMAMDEGIVGKWHVSSGDRVTQGQLLLEIESEKTTAEIEAPVSGVLGQIGVESDVTVPVGTLLVTIEPDS